MQVAYSSVKLVDIAPGEYVILPYKLDPPSRS